MKNSRFVVASLFVLSLVMCGCSKQSEQSKAADQTVAISKPEPVGFSTERLEALHTLMQQAVDRKQVSGAVTILARHGKVVDYRAYGQKDIASGAPMTKDAIFRLYSMTKPVTGVAMMILYEQGKWLPRDPIAKYIPEFAPGGQIATDISPSRK
jgi:CubicO group peptidase (beta-lactamase class C family)